MPKASGFFLFGLVCLTAATALWWQRVTPRRLSFRSAPYLISQTNSNSDQVMAPIGLVIKSVGIELPILPARIQRGGVWESTPRGVSYLSSSPLPGESGNSILYGHNWPNLLGSLPQVKPGSSIEIVFADGSRKKFVITFTSLVTPDQSHILAPTADSRITLYTCAGFLDSRRFVVTAIAQ